MAEVKQAQAARQKSAEVSRAREEQLDAFKARLLAERFAIALCNSMRLRARMHERTTIAQLRQSCAGQYLCLRSQ